MRAFQIAPAREVPGDYVRDVFAGAGFTNERTLRTSNWTYQVCCSCWAEDNFSRQAGRGKQEFEFSLRTVTSKGDDRSVGLAMQSNDHKFRYLRRTRVLRSLPAMSHSCNTKR